MAGVFPNRLSNDGADKLNHKWMVLVLLVLSLVAFIVPLHPGYHQDGNNNRPPAPATTQAATTTTKKSKPQLTCWCPAYFTYSYVNYANTYCTNAFIATLNGANSSAIYDAPDDDTIPVRGRVDSKVPLSKTRKEIFDTLAKNKANKKERESIKTRLQSLVAFEIPLMLLGIALVLVVPQLVWAFLSDCCGPFNLAETLTSATLASTMATDSQKQVYQDLSSALSGCTRNCPKSASIGYLIKKVLSVVAAIGLLIVVSGCAVQEIEDMKQGLDTTAPIPFGDDTKSPLEDDANSPSEVVNSPLNAFKHPKDVILCDFQIRNVQRIESFTIQCTVVDWQKNESDTSPDEDVARQESLLAFARCLVRIVTGLLAVVAVANVFSLCGWLFKLLSVSSRNSVHLSGSAAMDTVFLVQMARINCGAGVAHKLAHASGDFSKIDQSEMTEAT